MCSRAAGNGAGEMAETLRRATKWVSRNSAVISVGVGAVLVMYGFYRVSIRLMKFFLNVSDKQIFHIGMVCGVITAVFIAASVVGAHRHLNISPDTVYRAAVSELRRHPAVEESLGGFWRPGKFRGYAIESLRDAVYGSERRVRSSYLEMPAQRMQMIFAVRGAARDGMVSLEAFKRGGEVRFEMLSLDVRGTQEHVFLVGEDDHPLFPDIHELLGNSRAACEQKRQAREG